MCGFTQDVGDTFDWSIGNSSITKQNGSGADHTPGNILFLISALESNRKFSLLVPKIIKKSSEETKYPAEVV